MSVYKTYSKYVSLNVLAMIAVSCYILADTFFISKFLGSNGLAALNLTIPMYVIMNGTGMMIGVGASTKYSILRAQNNNEEANKYFTHSVLLGIIFSIVFIIIGIFLSKPIAILFGADENILKYTDDYIKTLLCFSPLFIANDILVAFTRNDGKPNLSMLGMVIGSLSNVVLDYVFIIVTGWGMFGAALATSISPLLSIIVISPYLIKKQNNYRLIKTKIKNKINQNIFTLGFSAFVGELSSAVVLIIFNLLIVKIAGNVGVAAYGVVANISLVVIAIFNGVSQGTQPLFSTYHGKNQSDIIKKLLKLTVIISVILAILFYFIGYLFADKLVRVFNSENNETMQVLAVKGIKIYFLGFLFAGINILFSSFYSAIERAKKSMTISLTRGFIAIVPIAILLAKLFGMDGIWFSFLITEAITLFLIFPIKINN